MAQWDFVQPLVTQMRADSAYNSLMSKLSSGAQVTPSATAGTSIWSSAATAVGTAAQNAVSNVTSLTGVVNQYLSAPL
jgi:ABC-type polysaccharide/polyol phosphate export permease